MDISQLKTLIHVAELGSLSKAADRLHIAQPALSRQIHYLEKELGVYLFERHGRGMVITDIGREVLEHAIKVMAELDAIRKSTAGENTSLRGTVVIGMGSVAKNPVMGERALVIFGEISDERFQVAPLSG